MGDRVPDRHLEADVQPRRDAAGAPDGLLGDQAGETAGHVEAITLVVVAAHRPVPIEDVYDPQRQAAALGLERGPAYGGRAGFGAVGSECPPMHGYWWWAAADTAPLPER